MKVLFSVHAGEFLVGAKIEKEIHGVDVWLPSKDRGVDLLVTNPTNRKMVSVQVKMSRSYRDDYDSRFRKYLKATSWWTPKLEKIRESRADLWTFVIPSFDPINGFDPENTQFILITPKELSQRLLKIHGRQDKAHMYLWVTKKNKCWETRGLRKKEKELIANDAFEDGRRDFTCFLNAWSMLEEKLLQRRPG